MVNVILVDRNNRKTGFEEKMGAHKSGKLHRAFSIFVFNSEDKLLIQKRNKDKYHSGGLWSNTCCSHPQPGERSLQAAHKRLKEEMGFDCDLKKKHFIIYKNEFDDGTIENEYDNIYVGRSDVTPQINKEEVSDYKWIKLSDLKKI